MVFYVILLKRPEGKDKTAPYHTLSALSSEPMLLHRRSANGPVLLQSNNTRFVLSVYADDVIVIVTGHDDVTKVGKHC